MNRVLNATAQRTADHAAPEITLDPLEIVGGGYSFSLATKFVFSHFIPVVLFLQTILSVSLAFVFQVRSDHQRTHICAKQHASYLVCHHPSFV